MPASMLPIARSTTVSIMPGLLPATATRAIAPMFVRRSNASATSFVHSMPASQKSRTSPRSDTVGERRQPSPPDGGSSAAMPVVGQAHALRVAADEAAHAFKGSLATIQSSIEPLRRAVPPENARARRALELIEAALGRLMALVEATH